MTQSENKAKSKLSSQDKNKVKKALKSNLTKSKLSTNLNDKVKFGFKSKSKSKSGLKSKFSTKIKSKNIFNDIKKSVMANFFPENKLNKDDVNTKPNFLAAKKQNEKNSFKKHHTNLSRYKHKSPSFKYQTKYHSKHFSIKNTTKHHSLHMPKSETFSHKLTSHKFQHLGGKSSVEQALDKFHTHDKL